MPFTLSHSTLQAAPSSNTPCVLVRCKQNHKKLHIPAILAWSVFDKAFTDAVVERAPMPQFRYMMHHEQCVCAGVSRNFVSTSLQLYLPLSCLMRRAPWATLSLHLWNAIELCYFSNVDSGIIAFLTALSLSQKPLVGPRIGIPNMRSLYCSPSFISVAILSAMNFEPKVEDSIVLWRLEYHLIGAPLRKKWFLL